MMNQNNMSQNPINNSQKSNKKKNKSSPYPLFALD